MHIVEACDVSKEYNGVRALDHVSFTVEPGDIFALVGPNGAGKTTLLRLLTRILRPDAGELRMFGSTEVAEQLNRIGYMPEERGLYKNVPPIETVSYFARLKGMSGRAARAAAEEALEMVGMAGHGRRKLEELSKGMAQRVQFAATIVHRPELLILDEPLSGLDPVSGRYLQNVIADLVAKGSTVLLSTHNMEHAERLCNRLLMLHRGHVCLYGSIADVKRQHTDNSLMLECAGMPPEVPGTMMEPMESGAYRIYPTDGLGRKEILATLVNSGLDIVRFEPVVPTLEDIFVKVAGEEGQRDLQETRAAFESAVV